MSVINDYLRGAEYHSKLLNVCKGLWKPSKIKEAWKKFLEDNEDFCPHCGYYCTGKSVFCTKG